MATSIHPSRHPLVRRLGRMGATASGPGDDSETAVSADAEELPQTADLAGTGNEVRVEVEPLASRVGIAGVQLAGHFGDRLGRQPLLVERLARDGRHEQFVDLAAERRDAVAVESAAETNTGPGEGTLVLGRKHGL